MLSLTHEKLSLPLIPHPAIYVDAVITVLYLEEPGLAIQA